MSEFQLIWDAYRERKIVGETKVSWVVACTDDECSDWESLRTSDPRLFKHYFTLVNKKNPNSEAHTLQWFFEEQAYKDFVFWRDNRYKLIEFLENVTREDCGLFRKVAELVGYKEQS